MELTCPDCGKNFEIEESQQAHEKQAAALKAQQEESQIETQRLLDQQKQQLAEAQDKVLQDAVNKKVEEQLIESKDRLMKEAQEKAELDTQRLLKEQKEQLAKDQDALVEAAVSKQLEEKQAGALKLQQQNLEQQTQLMLDKKDREREEEMKVKDSQHKLDKDRLAIKINELQAKMQRDQAVELKGEAAEVRLKEALVKRFRDDLILDVKKGQQGADLRAARHSSRKQSKHRHDHD